MNFHTQILIPAKHIHHLTSPALLVLFSILVDIRIPNRHLLGIFTICSILINLTIMICRLHSGRTIWIIFQIFALYLVIQSIINTPNNSLCRIKCERFDDSFVNIIMICNNIICVSTRYIICVGRFWGTATVITNMLNI